MLLIDSVMVITAFTDEYITEQCLQIAGKKERQSMAFIAKERRQQEKAYIEKNYE